jgi:hypothetical protein
MNGEIGRDRLAIMHGPSRNTTSGVGATMNRKRVIVLVTLAMLVMLLFVSTVMFRAIPPWPVLLWFAASHLFFCIVIARVKPFRGPYREPMVDDVLPEIDRGF